eukprot:s2396_g10.t1
MEEQKLVIGIDLGTADSYVAYIRGGAIEVVQNEVSQRKTPSLVGFTDRERLLGDTALSQIKSNAKNTCRNFKHLLGQRFDSPAVDAEKFWSTCPLVQTEDGFTGYSVSYKGETTQFSATEVTAMFLTKLKQVTEAWCGAKVADAVIAVPSYFADFQRQALLDAAAIADLHAPTNTEEHDHGMDEQDTRDSHLGSSSLKKDVPKTGKDHVPEYSRGTPMREYQRRVRLFESSTGIDPSCRAQKLMEKLTGQAWMATESLDLDYIKHPDGVKRLLQHLWQELEPLEYLRTFTTLTEFYRGFKRTPGMEYITYDMEFRAHLKRPGCQPNYGSKWWQLQGVSTTTVNSSELSWLPQGGNRHWKARNNNQPRQVHATLDDSTEDPEKDPVEEADLDPADLEGELEVLLTQVAKKRAQIEKARGFTKNETPTEREQRIKDMKARMPCSACKAHGKTVYGHWRGDAACPYKKDKEKNVLASGPARTMSTWRPHLMMMPRNKPSRGGGLGEVWVGAISEGKLRSASRFTLALSDTCCARSVAGEKWVQHHLRHLHAFREDTFIVEEARPFRFGAGPRVMSTYAVIIPVNIPGAKNWAHLRVSVVDQDVPLLISKSALKALGVVLDLARGCVCFGELCTDVPLRETIDINLESSRQQYECPHEDLLSDDCEVVLSEIDKSSQDQVWMIDENHAGNHQCRRATHQAVQGCESYARELRLSQDFSYAALLNLLRRLPQGRRNRHRQINGAPGPITGVFAHGNHVGVTKRTRKYPQVVKYINKFMRQRSDQPWSSFSLQRDVCTHVHKDVHNDKDAKSVTVTFGDFQGGQLWIADDDVDQSGKVRDTVWKQDDRGNSLPGRLVDTREKPLVDSDAWTALKRLSFPIKRWIVAPKKKEEYVQAIACWCRVPEAELRLHTVDRLKELYAVLKPKRRSSVLPANCKKLDLESLKELYGTRVVKDLDRPHDYHWSRWTKSPLILEIELWHFDVQSSLEHMAEDESPYPKCSECGIPMIIRTNRVTKREFLGCHRYPSCKVTLPLEYGGRPVREVIEELEEKDKIASKALEMPTASAVKIEKKDKAGLLNPRRKAPGGYPRNRVDRRSHPTHRGSRVKTGPVPVEEVSSDDEVGLSRKFNPNLTKEEIEMIAEMRRSKANPGVDKEGAHK